MVCSKCGKEVKGGYEFCMSCGTKIGIEVENLVSESTIPNIPVQRKLTNKKLFGISAIVLLFIVTFGICAYQMFWNNDVIVVPKGSASVSALNAREAATIDEHIKTTISWFNKVNRIDKLSYSLFDDENVQSKTEKISQIYDSIDGYGDDKIEKMEELLPSMKVSAEISRIFLESKGDWSLDISESYIYITDEDWEKLQKAIEEAIKFYYK